MVNDSAGTDVLLTDKSQRPAPAAGFRAAVAIEAERGLCNTPVLISSADAFVKVFGNPSLDKYHQANIEAYFLAQNNVPLVVSRAKNPDFGVGALPFGGMRFTVGADGALTAMAQNATSIHTPSDLNTAMIYFKGEGDYCGKNSGNIVLRFSEPATQSAYAKAGRVFQLQVFDFAGAPHVDVDTDGLLGLTPDLENVLGGGTSGEGDALSVPGYDDLVFSSGSDFGGESTITAFVNGRKSEPVTYEGGSVYAKIVEAITHVQDGSGAYIVPEIISNGNGTFTIPKESGVNCRNLSISISITASATGVRENPVPEHHTYGCGTVTVTPDADGISHIVFNLSTGLYLENQADYMYMGKENADWAAYYSAYLKESFIASFNYDDMDASGVSMQIDTVLASSNYLVARTSEDFGDYAIKFVDDDEPASLLVADLQYFDSVSLASNAIAPGMRSYAYSTALRRTMGNNLTVWNCVATPNLGDVMSVSDFVGVIEAAGETTLGLSNIGKAASLDVMANVRGRHNNRFITDFSQYGRRNIAGRNMWITMAALATLRLNINYNNGNEARPPMGINYGAIQCDALSEEFVGPDRKLLAHTYKINPAINENSVYLWEECTSQELDSSLSDTHVILSYCWMKYQLYNSMRQFVAEYNDTPTVNEGLRVLKELCRTFIGRKYILEGLPNADKNVIGDKVMRFDFPVRFMGVARYVDIYVTAYSQTQSLEISLAEEG